MIFEFNQYKPYLRRWIESQSSRGRGEVAKIAQHLNISSSLVSTIMTSNRHFSTEQAIGLSEYLKLAPLESEYFMNLISYEKAGSEKLKKYWLEQRKKIIAEYEHVNAHVRFEKVLTLEQQATYYSHAVYSQIRVLCTLETGISLKELTSLIKLPENQIRNTLRFLMEALLIRQKDDRYFATEQVVHIDRDSPHSLRHFMNWRLQQLQMLSSTKNDDLSYTFPCTLSQEDFQKIKHLLLNTISSCQETVRASPAEGMACLTIDFISYHSKK